MTFNSRRYVANVLMCLVAGWAIVYTGNRLFPEDPGWGYERGDFVRGMVTGMDSPVAFNLGRVEVRLAGVHVPSAESEMGQLAGSAVLGLINSEPVSCQLTGTLIEGRLGARCFVGSSDIAWVLLQSGIGRYCPETDPDGIYVRARLLEGDDKPMPVSCAPESS